MSESRAQELVEDVVRRSLFLLGADPRDPETLRNVDGVIDVSQQAINLGLVPHDEVYCRVMLATTLRKKMALEGSQELDVAFRQGISSAS